MHLEQYFSFVIFTPRLSLISKLEQLHLLSAKEETKQGSCDVRRQILYRVLRNARSARGLTLVPHCSLLTRDLRNCSCKATRACKIRPNDRCERVSFDPCGCMKGRKGPSGRPGVSSFRDGRLSPSGRVTDTGVVPAKQQLGFEVPGTSSLPREVDKSDATRLLFASCASVGSQAEILVCLTGRIASRRYTSAPSTTLKS